jgi:hypothetical protein
MLSQAICFSVVWVAMSCLAGLPVQAEQKVRAKDSAKGKSPRPCAESVGDPFTFAQIIEGLRTTDVKRCLVQYVEKRGVKFQATEFVEETLKELNAPPDLFRLIPRVPEPPKPPVAGPLTVTCQPRDCEIIINNRLHGNTENGQKVISGLPTGGTTILVRANSGENESRRLDLPADTARTEKFELRPDKTVLRHSGREILNRTVISLGGVEGLATLADSEGSGTVAFTDSGKQPVEWTMRFSQRWAAANLTFRSSKGECSARVSAEATSAECKGKLKNSGDENELARIAQLFSRSQLAPVLARLLTRDVVRSQSSDGTLVETEGGPESYQLRVDAEGLPVQIVYTAKAGADPFRIDYANYLKGENSRFPGRITAPDATGAPVVFVVTSSRARPSAPVKKGG